VKALLVDPSLYTGPYDAALDAGLAAAGVSTTWATRPPRAGERFEVVRSEPFFYRCSDQARLPARLRAIAKGCAHVAGMWRLLRMIRRERPDVVHFQWLVIPFIDMAVMALIRRRCAVILTVHDTVAYNGAKVAWLQRLGIDHAARLAHRVIVHTRAGCERLRAQGVPRERIAVIPHGPLRLSMPPVAPQAKDGRWTLVLFGEIKPYKGLDVLIEAVAALDPGLRRELRIIVAGRPRMDIAPCAQRIAALGADAQFELRLRRLDEEEMARLFAAADAFVFPYRHIDASGVFHLVRGLGKWLIATRVGVFAEEMRPGEGALVPPGDVAALSRALAHALRERPRGSTHGGGASWESIGAATRTLYEGARAELAARALPPRTRLAGP